MAKDVSNKSAPNSNTGNNSPPISDQQKVPPLRIVLNTSGNQKSSTTTPSVAVTTSNPQQNNQTSNLTNHTDLKREKNQDVKGDGNLKTGGRVRIKLGTNKQVAKGNSNSTDSTNKVTDDGPKVKGTEKQDNSNNLKEEINSNYSHLRRITRRSQRSIQTVSNEDEESVSSMTSFDENSNTNTTNNSTNSDNNTSGQDGAPNASSQQQQNATSTNSGANNNSSNNQNSSQNVETPRRYKRKRGETSESQLNSEHDIFGFQNYKLPVQNSFELYRNIRKQVDRKLKSLNIIHPKTPHGFRDYMLTRGAYLLDGNKLGNGTNLFMNEDGGLYSAPISKFQAFRHNRVNYSVPNRAKVPLGLPVNSPLYNLFIEQEKERYKMMMHHIKEREKLTLAAEQEVVRVYNQAAMAAANQLEPFSACTMLKHQEIYNYIDPDGVTIQATDEDHLEQIKQEGVRTRRRQHEHISPPPSRKTTNTDSGNNHPHSNSETNNPKEFNKSAKTTAPTEESGKITEPVHEGAAATADSNQNSTKKDQVAEKTMEKVVDKPDDKNLEGENDQPDKNADGSTKAPENSENDKDDKAKSEARELNDDTKKEEAEAEQSSKESQVKVKIEPGQSCSPEVEAKGDSGGLPEKADESSTNDVSSESNVEKMLKADDERKESTNDPNEVDTEGPIASSDTNGAGNNQSFPMEQDIEQQSGEIVETENPQQILSDDDRRAYNKEVFLAQLQEIDDKWERIRNETLIRHRNEAESLHAVQKLEWEWKTKESGACDVRTTLVIDNTLVPKLTIYSQDY